MCSQNTWPFTFVSKTCQIAGEGDTWRCHAPDRQKTALEPPKNHPLSRLQAPLKRQWYTKRPESQKKKTHTIQTPMCHTLPHRRSTTLPLAATWRIRNIFGKAKKAHQKKTLRKNRNKTRTKQAININNKERTKAVLGCQREKPVPKKRKWKTLKTEDPKNV